MSRRLSRTCLRYGALVIAAVQLFSAAPASAKDVAFDDATVAELVQAMESGSLTAERLVQLCLQRIEAFDRQGPKLHAVITLNPKAVAEARALDAERKGGKVRGPLHGIPVVVKDNFDTFDMATTGGSVLLEGWTPPKDAFMIEKLRAGGAIILAKVNLSEFTGGVPRSSLGGQSLNPHDLTRVPAGSSGGTGVAVAAGYAPLGLGTDTGGSIRSPSTANGIAGLKPTHGLLSRSGIMPVALSLDTGGPMARNVSDVAVMLGVMTGVDAADPATKKSQDKFDTDYTKFLKPGALQGARIGVARHFMGKDADVDWVVEASLDRMRKAGAVVVDVRFPQWLIDVRMAFLRTMQSEISDDLGQYLAATGPGYPKSIADLVERANLLPSRRDDGALPNPSRWASFKEWQKASRSDAGYIAVRDYGLPLVRAVVEGVIAEQKLDAVVYPTSGKRPGLIAEPYQSITANSPSVFANLTGFPDLIVPAGFTDDGLPVGLSFFGTAFSEGKLISLGYSFEQLAQARRRPIHTPALPDQTVTVK